MNFTGNDFIDGVALLHHLNYVTPETTVQVVEASSIWVGNLKLISLDHKELFEKLGWDIGYKGDVSSAEYHKLEYADY